MEVHIANIKKVYGEFNYAPYRTQFDPEQELQQLQMFLPTYNPNPNSQVSKPESPKKTEPEEKNIQNGKNSENNESNVKETTENLDHNYGMADDDRSMEGYGTDDETENNIDQERRRALLGNDNNESEGNAELSKEVDKLSSTDEGFETQSETSSFSESRSSVGKVRNRGGFVNSTGVYYFLYFQYLLAGFCFNSRF